jgi:peptidoglycan hydrolase-like protein with peptidoglycan-binding domain
MWVSRMSLQGGDPQGTIPPGVDLDHIVTLASGAVRTPATYDHLTFIASELLHGRLRQGWGLPGLDLRQRKEIWIENFIHNGYIYWKFDPTDQHLLGSASGRKDVLDPMLDMRREDVVFIPKFRNGGWDDGYFGSAVVSQSYRFEDRAKIPGTWEKDFGHIIGVVQVESHPYSAGTLPRGVFNPYRRAINAIRSGGQYGRIADFVRNAISQ